MKQPDLARGDAHLEADRSKQFPLGARLRLADLDKDPYPFYAALRASEPVSWVPELGMWYVTDYPTTTAILLDARRFSTTFERSIIDDILGRQMLALDGELHDRYKRLAQPALTAGTVRKNFEDAIREIVRLLLQPLRPAGTMEFRSAFASRLPIQVILRVFGMAPELEAELRRIFDALERALANLTHDPELRRRGKEAAAAYHALVQNALDRVDQEPNPGLLAMLAGMEPGRRLSDEEICRNAGIIFFGAISTVEALLLNCFWAFLQYPAELEAVRADRSLIPKAVEETMRWLSPAQSAHRVALEDVRIGAANIRRGEIISCMLGAANRDPQVFADPDQFRVRRPHGKPHLGFATGSHVCLGLNLARAEVRIALEEMLENLTDLSIVAEQTSAPEGYEFRQPRRLQLAWRS